MSKRITVTELATIVAKQQESLNAIMEALKGTQSATKPQSAQSDIEPAPETELFIRNLRDAAKGATLSEDRFTDVLRVQMSKAKTWAKSHGGASVWWTYSRNRGRDYIMFRKHDGVLSGGVKIATISPKGKVKAIAEDLEGYLA